MPATYYLANKLLDHQVGKANFTMPTVYVGLSSTTPTLAGGNITEPSGGSYARATTSAATWASAASGATTNAQVITFPTATADWVGGANLTYGVLYDALTGGNVLGYGALTVAKDVLNGDTPSIAIGDLDITLS
jgi:hypothetical protein